jgi:hypothetical protein
MIWAILAWYFFGGVGGVSGAILTSSGVDELREQIPIVVEDESRRKSASRTLMDLKKEVEAFEKSFGRSGRELNKLYVDHSDNREDTFVILDNLNSQWEAAQGRSLDLRFELRDELTEAEWLALFGSGE